MSTPREWWHAASPYLDMALSLSGEERARWLASLHASNPEIAALVQTLLKEYRLLGEEQYLEQIPVPLPVESALAGQAKSAPTRWYRPSAGVGWAQCGWPNAATAGLSAALQ